MHNIRIMILNYKRPENVHKLINIYRDIFPITVINNNPEKQFPYVGQPVDVINNDKNYYCMDRWVRCFEYGEAFKFILDDDILVHPDDIIKMKKLDQTMVGIYGKSNVSKASRYEDLVDHWCTEAKVDFLVGSGIMVKQSELDKIFDKIDKVGFPERGDDIIVSGLLKRETACILKTFPAKVLNLPEGEVGLNKDPNHFSMRWNVVKKFKNLTW